MNFVLDASVALAWAFEDEAGGYSREVLTHLRTGEAMAPSLWPVEVSNGLLVAERLGRIAPSDAARFTSLLRALPIVVEPLDRRRILESLPILARQHGLSAYDACYLEVALRQGVPLATLDEALRKAARSEGVTVFLG
jgi:predicted nucleic acid-binding protein